MRADTRRQKRSVLRWPPAALSPALLASLCGFGEAFTYTLPADFKNQPRALVSTVDKAVPAPLRGRIGFYSPPATPPEDGALESPVGGVADSLLAAYRQCCSESKEEFHIIAESRSAAVVYDALSLLMGPDPRDPPGLEDLSRKARAIGFKVGHLITLEPAMAEARRTGGGRRLIKPSFVRSWSNYHSGAKPRFQGPDLQLKFDLNDRRSRGSLILDIRDSPLIRMELLASVGTPPPAGPGPSFATERLAILRQSIADFADSQGGRLSKKAVAAWAALLRDAGPERRAGLYHSLSRKIAQSVSDEAIDKLSQASVRSAREREAGERGKLLRALKGLYVEAAGEESTGSASKAEDGAPPPAEVNDKKTTPEEKKPKAPPKDSPPEGEPGERLIDYGSGGK